MPKAHKYWTKKPRASHWGPSQKSGLSPGSSGKKYPSSSSSPSATPTFSVLPISLILASSRCSCCPSLVVVPLLLFLLSNLPVRDESFLAKTMWEVLDLVVVVVVMTVKGRDGRRKWRRIGRWVDGLVVVRPTPPLATAVPAIVRDMSVASEFWTETMEVRLWMRRIRIISSK